MHARKPSPALQPKDIGQSACDVDVSMSETTSGDLVSKQQEQDIFQRLLVEIRKEHEQQIRKLTVEMMNLKRQLCGQQHTKACDSSDDDHAEVQDATVNLKSEHRRSHMQESPKNRSLSVSMSSLGSFGFSDLTVESHTFEVKALWSAESERFPPMVSSRRADKSLPSITQPAKCNTWFLYCSPASTYRLIWDVLAMILLLWDFLTIPFAVFDPRPSKVGAVMNWITQMFWLLHMIGSFFVGYYDKGALVMSPKRIAKNYITGWFPFDLIVVCADWTLFFMDHGSTSSAGILKLGRSFRTFRVLRAMKLLRITQMHRLVEHIQDQINTEVSNLQFGVFRLFARILLFNHIVACSWFGVGNLNPWTHDTWVAAYSVKHRSIMYQYTTSLHWSLAQLGVSVTSIEPQNELERVYSIVVLLVALVLFTSMVGTITNIMQQIQSLKEAETRQFWHVRRFLFENRISPDLGMRVKTFLQHTVRRESKKIGTESVEIFRLLSDPLFNELQFEMYREAFYAHPFFMRILTAPPGANFPMHVIHRVAREATVCAWIAPGDIVFCSGDVAICAYFILTGCLVYSRESDSTNVRTGRWIADAVLWTSWTHQGLLSATEPSELLKLNAESFSKVVSRQAEYKHFAKKYACRCVSELNKRSAGCHTDLSSEKKWTLRTESLPKSPTSWLKRQSFSFRAGW